MHKTLRAQVALVLAYQGPHMSKLPISSSCYFFFSALLITNCYVTFPEEVWASICSSQTDQQRMHKRIASTCKSGLVIQWMYWSCLQKQGWLRQLHQCKVHPRLGDDSGKLCPWSCLQGLQTCRRLSRSESLLSPATGYCFYSPGRGYEYHSPLSSYATSSILLQ